MKYVILVGVISLFSLKTAAQTINKIKEKMGGNTG